jgi:nucleoid-associated protein YgaU
MAQTETQVRPPQTQAQQAVVTSTQQAPARQTVAVNTQTAEQAAVISSPPSQQAAAAQRQPASPPASASTSLPVIQAPAMASGTVNRTERAEQTRPPVTSFAIPATIPSEGVEYKIRNGDTLWDIAEAFYRNPFSYPRIARFNNILNPDLIISGTTIRVPPRN